MYIVNVCIIISDANIHVFVTYVTTLPYNIIPSHKT